MIEMQLPALESHINKVVSVAVFPDGEQTLYVSENWLVEGTTNLHWLPANYRPTGKAIGGGVVILGQSSGRLSILELRQGPKFMTQDVLFSSK